jgi:hypothetical protein
VEETEKDIQSNQLTQTPKPKKHNLLTIGTEGILVAFVLFLFGIVFLSRTLNRQREKSLLPTPFITSQPQSSANIFPIISPTSYVPSPSPTFGESDIYMIKVATYSAFVLPKDIYYLDEYLQSLFGIDSEIAYDTREGNPYRIDPYNLIYFLLTKSKAITPGKTYGVKGISLTVSRTKPSLLPYIVDSKYCVVDTDCSVRENFCSYGGFNHYSHYRAVWGCGPPTDEDAPGGPREFEIYNDTMKCATDVTYTDATCIKNQCTGQNRIETCME